MRPRETGDIVLVVDDSPDTLRLLTDALGDAGMTVLVAIEGEQALAINSDHADSLHLMGLLSHQAKQYDRATEWIVRALRLHPKPDYLANLGTALRHLGRHEEACKAFETAVQA